MISALGRTRAYCMVPSLPTSAIPKKIARNVVPLADAQLARGRVRLPAVIVMAMGYATVAEGRGRVHVGIATGVGNVRHVMGGVARIAIFVMEPAIALNVVAVAKR